MSVLDWRRGGRGGRLGPMQLRAAAWASLELEAFSGL